MEQIKFREVSDLGKILQKAAQFIRQNFLAIVKSSLLIVFLPFLIGAILTGFSTSGLYSNLGASLEDPSIYANPLSIYKTMLPGYFFTSISYMLFYIVCIGYIKQYVNGSEVIDQKSILAEVKRHFLKVFFGGILTVIIVYLGILFCLIPGIYFAVVFSHLFSIAIIEDKGFGESFNKSFSLIKGQWWNSFLLYFVASLITAGISFITILPMYIYMFAGMFKNIENGNPEAMFDKMGNMGWFMPFYMLVYLLILMVIATIQSMNYYNLVEGQEGIGEKNDIENIGS